MICRQRGVVQSPPLQIVEVPLRYRELCSNLHPMSLCFEIAEIWWTLEPFYGVSMNISLFPEENLPEYPHSPAAHLKSPATIRINGNTSHCEEAPRAGQRKEAKGYVGLVREDGDICLYPFSSFLPFRRGLCGAGPAMLSREPEIEALWHRRGMGEFMSKLLLMGNVSNSM